MNNSPLNAGAVTALGRLLLALIFILSGFGKLMAPGPTIGFFTAVHVPVPEVAYVVSVIVELGGGLALLLGFQARIVAAVLALFCLYTAFAVHGFASMESQSSALKNISMTGGFLYVIAYGAGAWSIDAMRQRRGGLSAQPA